METKPLLADKLAWDGKKLVVTDDTLIDSKLRRKALSASTSKSMQSCAARWVGERLLRGETEDPFGAAPLGTSAHSVMEDLYALNPEERTMARAANITLEHAVKMWPDNPSDADAIRAQMRIHKRRWIEEVRIAYEGIFVIENPSEIDVQGRELQINNLEIEGVPTNGFIDRVSKGVVNGRTGLLADDYKTGKVPAAFALRRFGDDHGDQLRIYHAALEIITGEKPVGATALYTKFGVRRPIDVSPAAVAKSLKVFKLSWKRHNKYMEQAAFPTKISALCGYCPLINSCPVAKAEGKVVAEKMADQFHSATALGIPTLRPGLTSSVPEATADSSVSDDGEDVVFFAPDEPAGTAEERAAVKSAAVTAAHISHSGTSPHQHSEKENTMGGIQEEKPWIEFSGDEMNPASYASMAAFGLASLAVERLHKAGLAITGRNVKSLAGTYHYITSTAQDSWTGSTNLANSANTRMRGAMRTVLETMPEPFGQDAEAWTSWVSTVTRRCQSITAVALHLFAEAPAEGVWESLAGVVPVQADAAPVATKSAEPVAEKVVAPVVKPVAEEVDEPIIKKAPAKRKKSEAPEVELCFPDDSDFDTSELEAA